MIVTNRALVAETRQRIAVNRRRLNPAFAVSGGADPELNRTARTLLERGVLAPIRSNVVWADDGSKGPCCVCGSPVERSQVEYEAAGGERQTSGCHFACFVAWQEESRDLPTRPGLSTS